jgi:enamine deaminase RidA (YjgF/YER057c/UK114 family)
MSKTILQPAAWPRPKGYSNGISASGRLVFTAGIIGWNAREAFEHATLAGQFRQALLNTRAILAEAGATPADLVRLTCYVTDKREYLAQRAEIGAAWREVFGKAFPCMAVIEVVGLIEDAAKIEMEATAVIAEQPA